MKIIIGTRGSKLALVQAEFVCNRLKNAYPENDFEIKIIKTKGDEISDKPLNQIGDKGLFVTEIERELISGEIRLAVHSMKDMPGKPLKGLIFADSWKREDNRDVLVSRQGKTLSELEKGAVIGTGSKRRAVQLKKMRPDVSVVDIRGNVDTRIKKMKEENLDGIILASAGLKRLGLESVITQYFTNDEMISAPAQGMLGIEVKADDIEVLNMVNALSSEEDEIINRIERGFLTEINGDCNVPVGAVCEKTIEGYELKAMFGNESCSEVAYVDVISSNQEELPIIAAAKIREKLAGKVYLIGAGPGDPGLITIKGMEILSKADCIIYDRLASSQLLEYRKKGCEMIYAGKENRHHTMKQDDINRLLVKKAMEYDVVVRLKGGDPYVFGRGGEEGITLRQSGVSFEVIPGISSAIAAAAYAGIPITHRGISQGFWVVTAHNRNDELADIDFEAMARTNNTCVFLMGLGKIGEIASNLMNAGKPADTPVAVISNGTTPMQKTCIGNLANIEEKVILSKMVSPAVIVVGDVVNLSNELEFYENSPGFGKSILVPKIGSEKSNLASLISKIGAEVTEIKIGQIENVSIKFTAEELEKVNWVIFSSANGVVSFFDSLKLNGLDARRLYNCRIAAIGRKTEAKLETYGIKPDLVPEEYNSHSLSQMLVKQIKRQDNVWYIKVSGVKNELDVILPDICNYHPVDMYINTESFEEIQSEWTKQRFDAVVFSSGSSVQRIINRLNAETGMERTLNDLADIIVSIGPLCSQVLEKNGIKDYVQSDCATYESMVETLRKTLLK